MDLLDVIRIFFKRWYVSVPLLLIVSWFSYYSYASVQPVYYANSVLTIAPPNQRIAFAEAGKPVEVNGLLEVGGPTLLTNMAVIACNDPAVKAKVVDGGGKWGFTVKNFPTGSTGSSQSLPLIMVETTQGDEVAAQKTVTLAANQVDPVLLELQRNAGVSDGQSVRAIVVSPAKPVRAYPSRTRAALGIFIGGLALSAVLAVVVDIFGARLAVGREARTRTTADSGTH